MLDKVFLSTLSLRRATLHFVNDIQGKQHFYPRSPCGERHQLRRAISCRGQFLSTLSLRRATAACVVAEQGQLYFYPRSPCGERPRTECGITEGKYFYPRSPCGERPIQTMKQTVDTLFLSTLSLRRATCYFVILLAVLSFLSTLSLRRATPFSYAGDRATAFLSTLSLRRATRALRQL